LKEEALDRTMWRARFGRGFVPVVRQTTKWMWSSGRRGHCVYPPRVPEYLTTPLGWGRIF
jgi:hypothetical protein